ncbi:MAG: hypothetical protein Q8Q12_21405 [bacterium]|nr:hypothetical protein [bacterium]
MRRVKRTGAWAWSLAAGMAMLALGACTSRAEVPVTETPSRVTVENESVRLIFEPVVNHVPAGKLGMEILDLRVLPDSAK